MSEYQLQIKQALDILDELQTRNLISYLPLGRGKVVKYKIRDWKKHNTVLDYNCPCQKDTGFFFLPVTTAMELVGAGKCCEMDILLDLWLSTVYNDGQVQGSEAGPVVYAAGRIKKMLPGVRNGCPALEGEGFVPPQVRHIGQGTPGIGGRKAYDSF